MFSLPIEFHFLAPPPPVDTVATRHADVHVVSLDELASENRGWTRGHVHIGFDDHPKDAPGHLDFAPLKLAALQTIDAGTGYAMHPHANIETLLFVLDGTLVHEDSLGNRVDAQASDLAVLTAGTGISHSEMVGGTKTGRALLFWLEPGVRGTTPRFATASFPKETRTNRLVALASGRVDPGPGALPLLRDAALYAARLVPGATVVHRLASARRAYVVATDALTTVNGRDVEAGERVLARGPGVLEIRAHAETDVFLFDID